MIKSRHGRPTCPQTRYIQTRNPPSPTSQTALPSLSAGSAVSGGHPGHLILALRDLGRPRPDHREQQHGAGKRGGKLGPTERHRRRGGAGGKRADQERAYPLFPVSPRPSNPSPFEMLLAEGKAEIESPAPRHNDREDEDCRCGAGWVSTRKSGWGPLMEGGEGKEDFRW